MKILDCSGASPLLIPTSCARMWRGVIDPSTDEPSNLNIDYPNTDYDRACICAYSKNGIIALGKCDVLVLYTDADCHMWLPELNIVMCGNWVPSRQQLSSAVWTNPLRWRCMEDFPLLCNSATDLFQDVNDEYESIQTTLLKADYIVDSAVVNNGSYSGTAHRFSVYLQ